MERGTSNTTQRATTGAGPSGLRLQSLLQKEIKDILKREEGNEDTLYLYGTGTHWVAFENSAYQLQRRHAEAELTPFFFDSYSFPVLMASIPAKSIGVTPADGKLALKVPPIDPKAYGTWRRRTVGQFEDIFK